MGQVAASYPIPGSPRGDQENTVRALLVALVNEFNGNVDASNLKDAAVTLAKTGLGANGLAQGAFRRYAATGQSPTRGNNLNFDSESHDYGGVSTQAAPFTAPFACLVAVRAQLTLNQALGATDWVRARIARTESDGSNRTIVAVGTKVYGNAANEVNFATVAFWQGSLSAGQILQVDVDIIDANARTLQAGEAATFFEGFVIGRL